MSSLQRSAKNLLVQVSESTSAIDKSGKRLSKSVSTGRLCKGIVDYDNVNYSQAAILDEWGRSCARVASFGDLGARGQTRRVHRWLLQMK